MMIVLLLTAVTFQAVAIFAKDAVVTAPEMMVLNQDGVTKIVLVSPLVFLCSARFAQLCKRNGPERVRLSGPGIRS